MQMTAQISANQANAQKSTGPLSLEGKKSHKRTERHSRLVLGK